MDLLDFVNAMANRFGSHVELEMLRRDLSYLVEVKGMEMRQRALVLGSVRRPAAKVWLPQQGCQLLLAVLLVRAVLSATSSCSWPPPPL